MGRRLAIATATRYPLTEDDALIVPLLRGRGIEVRAEAWDDPAVDWGGYDAVLLRSVWNYTEHHPAFLAWCAAVPHLLNDAEVVRWNTDKRYLTELEAAGIGIVPTSFIGPGEPITLPDGEFVVKPAVSASSHDTARYTADEHPRARAHAAGLHQRGATVMVQPYMDSIDEHGETAVIVLGGRISHAMRKGPVLQRGVAAVSGVDPDYAMTPKPVAESERELALRVLAATPWAPGRIVYARVDMVPGPTGEPVLMELELTEPALYLSDGAGAAELLAGAVADRLDELSANSQP